MDTFDNTNWTLVFSTNEIYKADILVEVLEENGILAMEMNRKDSNFPFGDIEIYVNTEDYENAMTIIKNHAEL
jgi:hypothetical protein